MQARREILNETAVGAELPYLLLRVALEKFQATPAQLGEEQHRQALQQAQAAAAMEERLLAAGRAAVSPAQIDRAMKDISERYPDRGSFLEDLKQNDLDEVSLRRALARELEVEAVVEQLVADEARVTDTEVEIFYWQHLERFTVPERRTVRHLLITVNDDYPENRYGVVKARIEELAAKLQQNPDAFAELAQRHSECPSAMHGGLVGTVPRGNLHDVLDEVLFGLGAGEVSDPIESDMGFHLLWCEAVEAAKPLALESVEEKIRSRLSEHRRRLCLRKYLSE